MCFSGADKERSRGKRVRDVGAKKQEREWWILKPNHMPGNFTYVICSASPSWVAVVRFVYWPCFSPSFKSGCHCPKHHVITQWGPETEKERRKISSRLSLFHFSEKTIAFQSYPIIFPRPQSWEYSGAAISVWKSDSRLSNRNIMQATYAVLIF